MRVVRPLCLGVLFLGSAPAAEPDAKVEQKLSDRASLEKWQVVDRSDFARHGKVQLETDRIVLGAGKPATGIRWTGEVSRLDHEISLEAMRVEGSDFKNGQWYKVRLQVTASEIRVSIDDKEVINVPTQGRQFSVWWEQEPVSPLGVATWHTTGALREICLRKRP